MVFERLTARLQEAFATDSGVKFFARNETIWFIFDERIIGRVKKANKDGVGQNIPTEAVKQFTFAEQELDGLGGLAKVELVYTLNRLNTEIQDISLLARDGHMLVWKWTLGKGAAGAEIVPFDLPFPPAPPSSTGAADEVLRAKRAPKRAKVNKRD